MKNKLFLKPALLLAILLFLPLMACSQTRLLADFPYGTDINKSYVSKYMIDKNKDQFYDSYGHSLIDFGLDGIDPKKLTGIEVYNCKNHNVFSAVGFIIKDMLEQYKAKPLIMNEDGLLISGVFILYKHNEEIGIAIVDSSEKEINVTILHGNVYSL